MSKNVKVKKNNNGKKDIIQQFTENIKMLDDYSLDALYLMTKNIEWTACADNLPKVLMFVQAITDVVRNREKPDTVEMILCGKTIGDKLKNIRRKFALSQDKFATNVLCTRQSISAYENNTKTISLKTCLSIAYVYNINLNWLLLDKGEPTASCNFDRHTFENARESIGSRVKEIRLLFGYSQEKFAELLNYSRPATAWGETATEGVSIHFYLKIATRLNVNLEWLLMGVGTIFNDLD